MKVAWVLEGILAKSSAYHQQVFMFSDFLHDWGHDSAVANVAAFVDDGDSLLQAVQAYQPDVMIAFGDSHPFELAAYINVPMLSWFLWGNAGLPDLGEYPLVSYAAVSKFAQNQLSDVGIDSRYVPHGFDPRIFYPGSRSFARARLGWTGTRPIVLAVGTNLAQPSVEPGPDRKNWVGVLESFALFLEERPDALLYAHTTKSGAIDITAYAQKLGIEGSVQLADQRKMKAGGRDFDLEHMADLYRASDVLLMPSLAEGFGIPLIEAQACGIPVVTTDGGPMTELVKTGTAVISSPHPENTQWMLPDTARLARALGEWSQPQDRLSVSNRVQEYTVENVIESAMLPALGECVPYLETYVAPVKRQMPTGPAKLDIGSGDENFHRTDETWTKVDKYVESADVQADMWDLPYEAQTVEAIWSSHSLEHVPRERVIPTLEEWYRVLRPGGTATLQVPDLDYVARAWLEDGADMLPLVFGSQAHDGEFHQTGWNLDSIRADAISVGFEIIKSEIIYTPEYSQDSIWIELKRPTSVRMWTGWTAAEPEIR